MRSILSLRIFASLPGSRLRFPPRTSLYSSINRLYAQNPVFEIVHDERVKVYYIIYTYMYNGNVQQNPLWICVESCVIKEFSISPWFSPAIFDPDCRSSPEWSSR